MLETQNIQKFNSDKSLKIASELVSIFKKRRTTRSFSRKSVDLDLILKAIEIAGSAPSGANRQPWHFVVIHEPHIREQIKKFCECNEKGFYTNESTKKWVHDLRHLYTDSKKAFLTKAPYLIFVLYKNYEFLNNKDKSVNYYAKESTSIATGMLISALHLMGLSTLTYTPTDRKIILKLLNRSKKENLLMLLAVGLPEIGAKVPKISKKTLSEIVSIYEDDEGLQMKDQFDNFINKKNHKKGEKNEKNK